jgi:hypothetical protein
MTALDSKKTTHDLRCFCRRRPLLALYGVDRNGKLYIEVKVYKQREVYGHIITTLRDGEIKLFCRECHRWYVITVVADDTAVLQEMPVSPITEEDTDDGNSQCLPGIEPTE